MFSLRTLLLECLLYVRHQGSNEGDPMLCWVLHQMEGPRFRSLSSRKSALFLEGCLVDLPDSKQPTFFLIVISCLFWERREVTGSRVWKKSGRLNSAGLWRENKEFDPEELVLAL